MSSFLSSIAPDVVGGLISAFGGSGGNRYYGPSNVDYQRQFHYTRKTNRMNAALARDMARFDRDMRRDALRHDPQHLVTGAQRAGFNPLTVLGATGGQSGHSPTGTGSVGGVSPSGGVMSQPISPAQRALQNVGDAIINYDPVAEERARLENELMEQRLTTADQKDARLGAGVPQVSTTSSPTRETPSSFWPNETNPWTINPSDSMFPVVDPASDRPEDTRITHGPYKGRYVMNNTEGRPFISPPNFTPAAMREELGGSLTSELLTTAELVARGWTPATVNDNGELIATRPKIRRKASRNNARTEQRFTTQRPGTIITYPLGD